MISIHLLSIFIWSALCLDIVLYMLKIDVGYCSLLCSVVVSDILPEKFVF